MNSINFKTNYPDVVKEKLDALLKEKIPNDFQPCVTWSTKEGAGITVSFPDYCGIDFAFHLGKLTENIESVKMIKDIRS